MCDAEYLSEAGICIRPLVGIFGKSEKEHGMVASSLRYLAILS